MVSYRIPQGGCLPHCYRVRRRGALRPFPYVEPTSHNQAVLHITQSLGSLIGRALPPTCMPCSKQSVGSRLCLANEVYLISEEPVFSEQPRVTPGVDSNMEPTGSCFYESVTRLVPGTKRVEDISAHPSFSIASRLSPKGMPHRHLNAGTRRAESNRMRRRATEVAPIMPGVLAWAVVTCTSGGADLPAPNGRNTRFGWWWFCPQMRWMSLFWHFIHPCVRSPFPLGYPSGSISSPSCPRVDILMIHEHRGIALRKTLLVLQPTKRGLGQNQHIANQPWFL